MPLGVPFKDSGGHRGRGLATETSRLIAKVDKTRQIKFRLGPKGYIYLELPKQLVTPHYTTKQIKITHTNAIGLAHWLLDNCSKFNDE